MQKKIGILILGAGQMAEEHGRAYFQNPEFSVLGVCDSNLKKASLLSKKLGFVPVYEDVFKAISELGPKALSICTWADSHFYYAMLGLKSGMQVFVEKPPALNLEEYKTLLAFSEKSGKILMSGFILHWHEAYCRWIELSRKLSPPLDLHISFLQHTEGEKWNGQKKQLEFCSPLLDTGIHYIDILLSIAKDIPVSIFCRGEKDPGGSGNFPNHYHLDLEFANGTHAYLQIGWGPYYPPRGKHLKRVEGVEGNLSLTYSSADKQRVEGSLMGKPIQEIFSKTRYELCQIQAQKFAMAIRGKLNLDEHHHRSLLSMEVIKKAEMSRKCGEKIPFSLNDFGDSYPGTGIGKLQQLHAPLL